MHFRQIYCNSLRIKKTQMLLNNNLYKIKYIYYTDFGSAWFYGGGSWTQLVLPEFDLGRLCGMTLYEIISLAIDLAILILAALSYLKDRKS